MVVALFFLPVLMAPGNHPSLEMWCPPSTGTAAEKRASGRRQLIAASPPLLSLLSFLKCQLQGVFRPDIRGCSGSCLFALLTLSLSVTAQLQGLVNTRFIGTSLAQKPRSVTEGGVTFLQ